MKTKLILALVLCTTLSCEENLKTKVITADLLAKDDTFISIMVTNRAIIQKFTLASGNTINQRTDHIATLKAMIEKGEEDYKELIKLLG